MDEWLNEGTEDISPVTRESSPNLLHNLPTAANKNALFCELMNYIKPVW